MLVQEEDKIDYFEKKKTFNEYHVLKEDLKN